MSRSEQKLRRAYYDTSAGQIHVRQLASSSHESQRPLVCLHPLPYSGLYFTTIMPMFNQHRQVIALDYPGYGGSDHLGATPSIEGYAQVVFDLMDSISPEFDCFGFHTGCLVAAELALSFAEHVRGVVMLDVPHFSPEQRNALYPKLTKPPEFSSDLECLQTAWEFSVIKREGTMAMERLLALFCEQLSTGEHLNEGFHAAMTYPSENRFPEIKQRVLILASASGLHQPTLNAAGLIQHKTLVELPEVKQAALELGAEAVAQQINRFLLDL